MTAARALVVETGPGMAFGAIAGHLAVRGPEAEFERGLRRFGMLLLVSMLLMVLLVFAISIRINLLRQPAHARLDPHPHAHRAFGIAITLTLELDELVVERGVLDEQRRQPPRDVAEGLEVAMRAGPVAADAQLAHRVRERDRGV